MKISLTKQELQELDKIVKNPSIQSEISYALGCFEELESLLQHECEYADKLSNNQQKFLEDAIAQDKDIDFEYSGRGMFGDRCPAVRLEQFESFHTDAEAYSDSLGLGSVVYARY